MTSRRFGWGDALAGAAWIAMAIGSDDVRDVVRLALVGTILLALRSVLAQARADGGPRRQAAEGGLAAIGLFLAAVAAGSPPSLLAWWASAIFATAAPALALPPTRATRRALGLAVGLGVALVVTATTTDLVALPGWPEVGVPRPARLPVLVAALVHAPAVRALWGAPLVLLTVPWLAARRGTRRVGLVALAALALHLVVLLGTPDDPALHLVLAFPGLALALVPTVATALVHGLGGLLPAARPESRPAPADDETPDVYDSAVAPHPFDEELRELLVARGLVRLWTARNLKLRYKRSALGILWTLIEPLTIIAILAVVFSSIFRFDVPNYPIYILCGWVVWDFFGKGTTAMATDTAQGFELTRRIRAPRSAFAVAALFTHLVNWAVSMIPVMLVMAVLGHDPGRAALATLPAMALVAAFALGIGLVVATLTAFFHDFSLLYQVLLTVWLYATPLIYPLEIVPEKVRPLFLLNPLTHLLDLVRQPLYAGTVPPSTAWLTGITLATVSLVGGWWLFTRSREAFERNV